jgi:hypothetical protein
MNTFVQNLRSRMLYKVLPKLVDWVVVGTSLAARKKISRANAQRVLVDNCVLGHAVTHESGWIDTGKKLWGGNIEIDTGYLARIPVQREDDLSEVARSVRYLPAIASLARRGHLNPLTSSELLDERWTQPIGRFQGYDYYDYNIFSDINFGCLIDSGYKVEFSSASNAKSVEDQRRARLALKSDPLYLDLVKVLGEKNSQDAYHITIAERNSCYCFLTMDFKLVRNVEAQKRSATIASLKTRVITPEEFGRSFSLTPISPRLFSYHCASFPVHHELNWPGSARQNRRKKKLQD